MVVRVVLVEDGGLVVVSVVAVEEEVEGGVVVVLVEDGGLVVVRVVEEVGSGLVVVNVLAVELVVV